MTRWRVRLTVALALVGASAACGLGTEEGDQAGASLAAVLDSVVQASGAEVVGIYYRSLAPGGDSVISVKAAPPR